MRRKSNLTRVRRRQGIQHIGSLLQEVLETYRSGEPPRTAASGRAKRSSQPRKTQLVLSFNR